MTVINELKDSLLTNINRSNGMSNRDRFSSLSFPEGCSPGWPIPPPNTVLRLWLRHFKATSWPNQSCQHQAAKAIEF